ncbi:hypothetical protein CHS0354_006988 [Potamilus streckersoni]|uniref:Uncharacterized protein n=1 Tax=Potamilus streckersoni TaxID=2493646 RepID=A0AAE0RWK6_9BIVA|nr:hypothetical protein CHS0354_006988 [Potamilus streckersoni]
MHLTLTLSLMQSISLLCHLIESNDIQSNRDNLYDHPHHKNHLLHDHPHHKNHLQLPTQKLGGKTPTTHQKKKTKKKKQKKTPTGIKGVGIEEGGKTKEPETKQAKSHPHYLAA